MDFEGLEEIRVRYITMAFEGMVKVLENDKATIDEKIKAARTIDAMSDTIVKAKLVSDGLVSTDGNVNKLTKQLGKLTDNNGDE